LLTVGPFVLSTQAVEDYPLREIPYQSMTAFDVARSTREARLGSQAAFAHLYRRFAPLVHGILLGRYRPALADELTQDCFATAFGRLSQLKDDHKFGPWIALSWETRRHGYGSGQGFGPERHLQGMPTLLRA